MDVGEMIGREKGWMNTHFATRNSDLEVVGIRGVGFIADLSRKRAEDESHFSWVR